MKSVFEASLIACVLALAAGCSSADNSSSDPGLSPASTETGDGNASPLSQSLVAPDRAPLNPCAAVLCLAPSRCDVVDGQAVCSPIESEPEPDACAAVRCRAGRHCEVIDERASCVRDEAPNPCAAVSCLAPSSCEVVDGEAVCVPIEPVNPCAAVSCLAPSSCEVVDGEAVCVPIELGPFCGGIAAFQCPGAGSCVDDPRDDCDLASGGADCSGVCECQIRALCIPGLVFDDSPEVCSCVPAGDECRADAG